MQIDLSTKEIKALLKLISDHAYDPILSKNERSYLKNPYTSTLGKAGRKIRKQYLQNLDWSGWKDPEEGSLPLSRHIVIERDDYTITSGNMVDENFFVPDNAPSGVDYLIPVDEILRWKDYPEEGED